MYLAERFDLNSGRTPRITYIVASSHRSGSTHLCALLWRTGKLGAPWEYLEYQAQMPMMMSRLKATSLPDYLSKLLACRTSNNGVFGLKAHFHHFDHALKVYPGLLDFFPDVKFILINRKDKLAQAVSMAKALQNNAWVYFGTTEREVPLFYSFEFIKRCLQEVVAQAESWLRWFETNRFEPLVVDYESLLRDPRGTLQCIGDYVGVDVENGSGVDVPVAIRQGDSVNEQWIQRFMAEAGM